MRSTHRRGRFSRSELAVIATLAALVIVTFLPWVWSGGAARNSYALARSAVRIGVLDGAFGQVVFRLWFTVPLLAASSFVAVVTGWTRLARTLVLATSIVVGAGAIAVLLSSVTAGLGTILAVPTALATTGAVILDQRAASSQEHLGDRVTNSE